MPDIKIKKQRFADKENLKKLMKYSKDTFANKSEINNKFYTKKQIDTMLEEFSGGTGGGGTGGGTCGDCYTKSEIDTKLNSKANKTTTLSGYGITDAYTKTQVDKKVSDLVNSAPETLATLNELAKALGDDPNFATTVATQIGKKANSSDVYNKSETDTLLSDLVKKSDLAKVATTGSYNDLLDKPTSFDVDLSNYYTKSEVYNLLSNYYTKKQIDIMLKSARSDKYGESIMATEAEGGDDTPGGLSFWNAVERVPGFDGTSQMNIAEDSNTVEDE